MQSTPSGATSPESTIAAVEASSNVVFCGWSRKRVAPYLWASKYFVLYNTAELLWYDAMADGKRLRQRGALALGMSAVIQRNGSGDDYSFRVGNKNGGFVRIDPGNIEAFNMWQDGLQLAITQGGAVKRPTQRSQPGVVAAAVSHVRSFGDASDRSDQVEAI